MTALDTADVRHGYALSFGKRNSPGYVEACARFDRWFGDHADRLKKVTQYRMIREGWHQ